MTHEKFEGERTLMRIHIGESDRWHGKPLHEAIVEMLRKENFSGATVLRGVGGFGSSSVYHTDKILRLSQDLPIVVEVIESTERIESSNQLTRCWIAGLMLWKKCASFSRRKSRQEEV
jgi:PII-like signaling protein